MGNPNRFRCEFCGTNLRRKRGTWTQTMPTCKKCGRDQSWAPGQQPNLAADGKPYGVR